MAWLLSGAGGVGDYLEWKVRSASETRAGLPSASDATDRRSHRLPGLHHGRSHLDGRAQGHPNCATDGFDDSRWDGAPKIRVSGGVSEVVKVIAP